MAAPVDEGDRVRMMKRALAALVGVALAALLVVVEARISAPPAAVYTVAQVRGGMGRQPRLWVGRTVLVRALAFPLGANCPPTSPWCTNVVLADRDPALANTPTLVAMAAQPNPYRGLLRQIPLAERLIPDPQQVDWGRRATYRVHLSAQSFTPCLPPCMNVQLEGLAR